MPDLVKILVCCHAPVAFPWDDVFTPVLAGHALFKGELPDDFARAAFFDDDGENISRKNPIYNELTAVYWAWKNYDKLGNPAFIGLTHYRRHLIFDVRATREVVTFPAADERYFEEISYPDGLFSLLREYDFLYLNGRVSDIRRQFAENHDEKDLDLAVRVVKRKHPTYARAAERFLRGSEGCFCNVFVFPRALFFAYCRFVFSVLFAYEKKRTSEKRLFVSERITGIFVRRLQEKGYRGAPLSSTLLQPPPRCVLCIPYDPARPFRAMTTLTSFLEHAGRETYDTFLFCKKDPGDDASVAAMRRRYPGTRITATSVAEGLRNAGLPDACNDERLYPFIAGAAVGERDKILYAEAGAVATRSAADLYDLYADPVFAGACAGGYGGAFLLDPTKLRASGVPGEVCDLIGKGVPIGKIRDTILQKYARAFPQWRVRLGPDAEEKTAAQILCGSEETAGAYARAFAAMAARVPLGVGLEGARATRTTESRTERKGKKRLLARVARYVRKNGLRKTYQRVKREIVKRI